MKTVALLLSLLMAGCAAHSADSAQSRLTNTAERQQTSADKLADGYLDCIDSINHKTAAEHYTDPSTHSEVVLESCREVAMRFTILQEQAYDNVCQATGKSSSSCDNEAVSKAKRDTDALLQKAHKRIDEY